MSKQNRIRTKSLFSLTIILTVCLFTLQPVLISYAEESGTDTSDETTSDGTTIDEMIQVQENDSENSGDTGLANPASVYCLEQGYELEIRIDEEGGQYGVCKFPDGSECEEWEFYNGECQAPGVAAEGDAEQLDEGDPDSYSASNETTGPDSENNSSAESNDETTVENNNEADLKNVSYIEAITGQNIAGANTGSGLITTDDANGTGEIVNIVNKNILVPSEPSDTAVDAENSETGPGSDNTVEISASDETAVDNSNISYTANEIFADIDSGSNISDYNTGHGIVISGDANLGLNMINLANTNLFGSNVFDARWLNVYENYSGDITFKKSTSSELAQLIIDAANKSTGPMSDNNIIIDVNDSTEITNNNTGELKNKVEATVSSGRNSTSTNTGSGTIVSGDVNAALNTVNFLNTNVTSSNWWLSNLNVFGNWTGDIILPEEIFTDAPDLSSVPLFGEGSSTNENTGPGSTNNTEINTNESFEVDNFNEVIITNDIHLNADTGGNDTSYNTGTGQSKEGEAFAESSVANVANLNITGKSWWLVIVNKFGPWNGSSKNMPQGAQIQNNEEATILTPLNSGIELANSSTGPLSENSVVANVDYSTEIGNVNRAEIVNDFTIDAITGENKASMNTGHGYIDTGDIRAATNTVNFANSNISVGNFLVSVVNVFGDWVGDLVFPESGPETGLISAQGNSDGLGADSLSSSNNTTGYNSDNNASSSVNNSTDIENNNTADVDNNVNASSSTGENSASYNTGHGIVTTGQASTDSSITNEVNTNSVSVDGGDGGVSGSVTNDTTGANSNNDASGEVNNNTTIINNNDIVVGNDLDVSTSTGANSADYNTGTGTVDTGDASTVVDLVNQFNNNEIDVETFGELLEQETSNNTTGANSDNSSNIATNNDIVITNDNSSEIYNSYDITNETGGNSADYNLGMGGIGTGSASTGGGVSNLANSNDIVVGAANSSEGIDEGEGNVDNGDSGTDSDSEDSDSEDSASGDTGDSSDTNDSSSSENESGETSPSDGDSSSSSGDESSSDVSNTSGSGGSGGGSTGSSGATSGGSSGGGGGSIGDNSTNGGEISSDSQESSGTAGSVAQATIVLGDLNGDGVIDDYDFSILMANWGKDSSIADLNGDGRIDDYDFSIVMAHWTNNTYLASMF